MRNQALFSSKVKSKELKCHLLQFLFGAVRVNVILQSKKTGNDQELIQSNPTFHSQNQKEKKPTLKLTDIHERHAW